MVRAIVALCVGLVLATLALRVLDRRIDPIVATWDVLLPLGVIAYAAVGALIRARASGNRIGWLFLGFALILAAENFAYYYHLHATRVDPGSLPAGHVLGWTASWLGPLEWTLLAPLLLLLFPTGRLPSRRWRPVLWLTVGSAAVSALTRFFWRGIDVDTEPPLAPLGLVRVWDACDVVSFAMALAAIGAAVSRWRRALPAERQQLKWLAFVVAIVAFALPASEFMPPAVAAWRFLAPGVMDGATLVVFVAVMLGIPTAVGVAILRYRLYDIDLVINRALVYGALTIGLGLIYVSSVLVCQQLFRPLAGGSDLAVAASTLAVAAAFRPARKRIQDLVDRRFYRRKYDAARTVEAFSSRLRAEVDLEVLAAELRSVVQETMQPAHVGLWLPPPARSRGERA